MAGLEAIDPTVQELMTILGSQDDLHDMRAIANERRETRDIETKKCAEIKQIISELLSLNEAEQKKVAAQDEHLDTLRENVKTSKLEKNTIIEQIGKEKENWASVLDTNEKLKKEAKEIQEEGQRFVSDLPNKYLTSLFSNISRIRWDHSADENDVKGYVTSLDDVKPFSLNSQTNSNFFITNYLWDLIDT